MTHNPTTSGGTPLSNSSVVTPILQESTLTLHLFQTKLLCIAINRTFSSDTTPREAAGMRTAGGKGAAYSPRHASPPMQLGSEIMHAVCQARTADRLPFEALTDSIPTADAANTHNSSFDTGRLSFVTTADARAQPKARTTPCTFQRTTPTATRSTASRSF